MADRIEKILGAGTPLTYEDAKQLARHEDENVRAELAGRADLRPEILYFLAEDSSPKVRRLIAENLATPHHADLLLARDDDQAVRGGLAEKISRLAPDMDPGEQDKVKRMAYEAVHRIESWDDLKNRLDRDRRCYAFFHPRMPNEPLIFVEIALAKGLPGSVQVLLDEQAPISDVRKADTAVFYSISNAQKGLRGISLGNLLLKRVIAALQRDLPWLQVFCTLSPIPGLRRWLERAAPELARDGAPDAALREPLLKACARYLVQEKKDGLPLDPVAQFHLHNGASVDRIFWAADASARGMQQSLGMMVSYRYALADVDRNHEEFLSSGHVAAARRVLRLL